MLVQNVDPLVVEFQNFSVMAVTKEREAPIFQFMG